jgi:hypothetical protein
MARKLDEFSVAALRKMLHAATKLAGDNCQTAVLLRQLIARKKVRKRIGPGSLREV